MAYAFDPDKIVIDDHTVPDAMKKHPEYLRRRQDIKNVLHLPNALEKFCTHEAGHLIYLKRAGLPDPEFFGPTITYDGRNFDHCTIGVKPPDMKNSPGYFSGRFMIKLARVAVAGGVFSEELLHCSKEENGDSVDWDLFVEYCKNAQRHDTGRSYNPDKRWRKARAQVKKDLDTQVITGNEIQSAKEEIKRKCFYSR